MSVFTNPASAAAEAAEAYVTAILKLLGDQDPHQVLRRTPGTLRAGIEGRTREQLRRPERPGKWSATDVLQHLADSDLVWAYRLRVVIAEERPPLTGYDQDRWAERLGYRNASPERALEQFELLRALNLRLLDGLTTEDLNRVGVHTERGEESVAYMVRLYAGHDLVHLRQLTRILGTSG
jgi:hypothetical protein